MNSIAQPQRHVDAEYVAIERHVLQENIVLIDAKSGILMALAGILIVHCLDALDKLAAEWHELPNPSVPAIHISIAFYLVALIAFFATACFTWYVVKPRLLNTNDFVYWESDAFVGSEADFVATIRATPSSEFGLHFLRHLYVMARICRDKYRTFAYALRASQVAVLATLAAEIARYTSLGFFG